MKFGELLTVLNPNIIVVAKYKEYEYTHGAATFGRYRDKYKGLFGMEVEDVDIIHGYLTIKIKEVTHD